MAAAAHFLNIHSTRDISLEALATVFDDDLWKSEARIDEQQLFFKSSEPPSWVQLVASLPWWGQLGAAGVSVVVSGYLKELGASIWKNQPAFAKFTSDKLWSLASKIVTLQDVIPSNAKIKIGFSINDSYFPVDFILSDLTIDSIAFHIAALCHHQAAIETFTNSTEFNPAHAGGWMELLSDGSIILSWQEKHEASTLEKRSRTFSI